MPLICCEVLWCRYHRVSVTGMLPWAYPLSQTKSSATTLLGIQRETALMHKHSLPLTFLCGLANYSHMYAIPPWHILLMSHGKKIQMFCSLCRDKEHSHSQQRAPKNRFATPMKCTDKPSAVMNHKASMYEFWYRCYFQNPGLHIDYWRSSVFYESKIYDLGIWNKKPTAVHSKRKSSQFTIRKVHPEVIPVCLSLHLSDWQAASHNFLINQSLLRKSHFDIT